MRWAIVNIRRRRYRVITGICVRLRFVSFHRKKLPSGWILFIGWKESTCKESTFLLCSSVSNQLYMKSHVHSSSSIAACTHLQSDKAFFTKSQVEPRRVGGVWRAANLCIAMPIEHSQISSYMMHKVEEFTIFTKNMFSVCIVLLSELQLSQDPSHIFSMNMVGCYYLHTL